MAAADVPRQARSDLAVRTGVGLLLIAVAIAALWAGGWAFALLVAVSVLIILGEWAAMHNLGAGQRLLGFAVLALVLLLAASGLPREAILALFVGAGFAIVVAVSFGVRTRGWLATGLLYAGSPAIALIWLRGLESGFQLVLWALAMVWATDIAAYFTGRAVGGPRLAPAVSPNKTWSGLIGGVIASAATSMALGLAWGWQTHPVVLGAAGAGLAILAQAGDLYESGLKRRAGVKDSGRLLPGHGGVMDRLDGLVPVAVAVALTSAVWGSPA
jgi:phosphatidate cytidylyltransferase